MRHFFRKVNFTDILNIIKSMFQSIVIARSLPSADEFPLVVHFFYLSTLPPKCSVNYWNSYLQESGKFYFQIEVLHISDNLVVFRLPLFMLGLAFL